MQLSSMRVFVFFMWILRGKISKKDLGWVGFEGGPLAARLSGYSENRVHDGNVIFSEL